MSPEAPEALRVALRVIEILEAIGVSYHVGGSYASSIHGVPRQTQDLDLVVDLHAAAVRPLLSGLGSEFYADEASARRAVESGGSFNLVHLDSGLKVDLFVRGDGAFDREEFARSRLEILQADPERRAFVKTPEDTVLRKLQWYRLGDEVSDRQWTDILGVLRTQGARLDRSYLERWARFLHVDDLLAKAVGESGGV